MTSPGVLYVDEQCRDIFQKELDTVFGIGEWELDGNPFSDYWNTSRLPEVINVNVLNLDDEVIGSCQIRNEFTIQEENGERFVEASPKEIMNIKGV